jgi:hypothetical protein
MPRVNNFSPKLINHLTPESFMDTDAMRFIVPMLTFLSYIGVFILGYSMRSYIYLHQRR